VDAVRCALAQPALRSPDYGSVDVALTRMTDWPATRVRDMFKSRTIRTALTLLLIVPALAAGQVGPQADDSSVRVAACDKLLGLAESGLNKERQRVNRCVSQCRKVLTQGKGTADEWSSMCTRQEQRNPERPAWARI
jgi:hypothetical protein